MGARGRECRHRAPHFKQTRARPDSCASPTWPYITPECITGTAEPAKVPERSVPNVEEPSSILRPRKHPLPTAVAQELPAAPPATRASEPIQFRLADRGN